MMPWLPSLGAWSRGSTLIAVAVLVGAAVALVAVEPAAVAPLAVARVAGEQTTASASSSVVWRMDRLDTVGGHTVKVVGAPRVVEVNGERVVEFDGAHDGLVVGVNPLAGLARFTIEVVFEPAIDGPEEQRFLHVEESGAGSRALIELRMLAGAKWCLDTYLRHGELGLTLIDRDRAHAAGQWHAAALTFDGQTMTHYVNRARQGSGAVVFPPMKDGQTSLGVRQNMVSFFKGRIRLVRFTPEALAASALLEPPG